ncbi:MAG: prepilin-type N-terminal cleavage/methylation domain-containing protein [bacterium]
MSRHHARKGFTLLELLVVLMVLSITAAAAVPAFLANAANGPERNVAKALAEELIAVRDAARESGTPATLALSPSDGRYWITTRDSASAGVLPMIGGVTLIGDRTDHTDRIELRFEPTGPSSPTTITVHGAHDLTVRTHAWTGEVTIDDGHAP